MAHITDTTFLDQLRFDAQGLIPALALDHASGEVLMMAWMNRDTLLQTLETGTMTYWSRSRQEVWVKGLTSGNTQRVVSVKLDCDGDVLLFRVEPLGVGAACHEGFRSCFWRELAGWNEAGSPATAAPLWEKVGGERLFDPKQVYRKE